MSISPISGISPSGLAHGASALAFGATTRPGMAADTFAELVANAKDPNNATRNTSDGFSQLVTNALDSVGSKQANADRLAELSATGQLQDPHEYMIAATEASLATELTVAVRNKAIEAFNDIMRMNL